MVCNDAVQASCSDSGRHHVDCLSSCQLVLQQHCKATIRPIGLLLHDKQGTYVEHVSNVPSCQNPSYHIALPLWHYLLFIEEVSCSLTI